MIRYRLLSAGVLIPIVLGVTCLGGVWFLGLVMIALTLAGYEYTVLLKRRDDHPALVPVLAIIWLFILDAAFPQAQLLRPGLTMFVLGTLTWAIIRYERGCTAALIDWAWTNAGGLYLGWLGAHFILLRNAGLPLELWPAPAHGEGTWWTALALGTAWLGDTGAYFIGRTWGKHKISPLVSPNKTWEGYVGGGVTATVSGVVVTLLLQLIASALGRSTTLTTGHGLILGALIGLLSPLGDLGESLIKRHAGVKDSSRLIPGHGGLLDRIDSLLWAGAIAFYYAIWAARL